MWPIKYGICEKPNPPVLWRGDSWSSVFHHSAVVVVEHAMLIDQGRSQTTRGVTFSRLVPKLSLQVRPAIVRCHLHSNCQPETLVRSREMGAPLLFILWSGLNTPRFAVPMNRWWKKLGGDTHLPPLINLPPTRGGSKGRTCEKDRNFRIRHRNYGVDGLSVDYPRGGLKPGLWLRSLGSENPYVPARQRFRKAGGGGWDWNRGDRIRTCDFVLPKHALCQTELRPVGGGFYPIVPTVVRGQGQLNPSGIRPSSRRRHTR